MRKILFILTMCSVSIAYSQGIVFETGKFADVIASSQKNNKIIFIDFYTDWCGPCRTMSQNIFPIKEVGDFYNANFVSCKINAEKGEGIELAKKYSVSAYPTYFFMNDKGDVIYKFMGARDQAGIIKEGNKALLLKVNLEKISLMDKVYNNKKTDIAFLKEYVDLFIESGKEAGEPLNEYILMLDNEAMLAVDNAKYFENITLYSPSVMDKIIAPLPSLYKTNPKADQFVKLNRAAIKSLSTLLRNSGKKTTPDELESLLVLKSKFADFGNKDNIIGASMGGGTALMPADEIRLSYYKGHKMFKEYSPLFESYVDGYIALNSSEKIAKENEEMNSMLEASAKKLAEAGKSEEEIASTKKMFGLVNAFKTVNNRYYASFIINGFPDYLKFNNNNEKAIGKITEWLKYSYSICKQYDVAEAAAKALIDIKKGVIAKEILDDFIKINTNNNTVTPEQKDSIKTLINQC